MNKSILLVFITVSICGISGCNKTDIHVGGASSPSDALAKSVSAPTSTQEHQQSPAERLVEIDRLLSAPLTGQPQDSDRRVALRAERAALLGSHSSSSRSYNSQPGPAIDPSSRQQATNGNVMNYAPPSESQNHGIVVAGDSQGDHSPHRISALEQMTPSERKHYFQELRLQNPRYVLPYGYDINGFRRY